LRTDAARRRQGSLSRTERPLLEAAFFDQIISSMVKARAQRLAERAASRPSLVPVSRIEPGFRFLERSGMFKQIKQAACFLSIGAFGIVGCSEGNAVNTAAPAQPAQLLSPGVPQTPDAAVQAVLEGLKASKPVVVWDAMASSNQAFLNRLIRNFASAADPEIWNRTVVNLKKAAQLAETKKEFIFQSPLVRSAKGISAEEVKASWDPGLRLLKTILQSELVDQEKMKNFDGRLFLDGTGAQLFAEARAVSRALKNDPLKQIDNWKASVQTISDRSATALVDLARPKKGPIEIPLAVQEGKWTTGQFTLLQFVIVNRVDPISASFRPYCMIEWKDRYLADMRRIERALDQLQAAKTNDDFQAVVALQVLPFVVQKMVQFGQKSKPLSLLESQSQNRTKGTAMVLVKGEHFADEPGMLELMKVFRGISKEEGGVLAGPTNIEGTTAFLVSPVMDANALVQKIHVGKITKIDVKRNKISLELPPSPIDDKATANADGASHAPTH
jgi:hypothetical protein